MNVEVVEGVVLDSKEHYEPHGGGIPATLHQDFWLRFSDGTERRYHLVDCGLGLRRTNIVALVLVDSLLAAVVNRTAKEWVAFPMPARQQKILPYFIPALIAVPISTAYVYFSPTPSLLLASILCVLLPILATWRLCAPDEKLHRRRSEQRSQIVNSKVTELCSE